MENNDDYNQRARNIILEGSTSSNTSSVMQKKKRLINELDDVKLDDSRRLEKIKISLVDEVGKELPKFVYIPQNTPYQDAYVPFSLARISNDSCCKKCVGDCLTSRVPCACSRETRGELACITQGLLKHDFLDDCISMNLEPQKHHLFHCQTLEKAKNEHNSEASKGHVLSKFIKECWKSVVTVWIAETVWFKEDLTQSCRKTKSSHDLTFNFSLKSFCNVLARTYVFMDDL